jgi:putative transposase
MQDINEERDKKFKEKLCMGEMSNERREIIEKLIRKYENIIEYDEEKLEKLVKHEIEIKENQEPIVQKRYKETDEKEKFIKKEVEQLLKMSKIRESKSPWASPVTLAKKEGADYRFCIDYRKLNDVTKKDSYLLPRIDELLEKYKVAKWFTSLDLAAGYHQIEMEEKDKEKIAFICSQ